MRSSKALHIISFPCYVRFFIFSPYLGMFPALSIEFTLCSPWTCLKLGILILVKVEGYIKASLEASHAIPPLFLSLCGHNQNNQCWRELSHFCRGFSAAQWESKATLQKINKVKKDFHISNSMELNILHPNDNMTEPFEGSWLRIPLCSRWGIGYPSISLFVLSRDPSMLLLLNSASWFISLLWSLSVVEMLRD